MGNLKTYFELIQSRVIQNVPHRHPTRRMTCIKPSPPPTPSLYFFYNARNFKHQVKQLYLVIILFELIFSQSKFQNLVSFPKSFICMLYHVSSTQSSKSLNFFLFFCLDYNFRCVDWYNNMIHLPLH